MHQRKGKKIIIYIFFLIILGSINNISLNQIKFNEIKEVNISGFKNIDGRSLYKEIENFKFQNIFYIDGHKIKKLIESNTLVESFKIFKRYPSTLDIEIEETSFLAKINLNNQIFLVGSNGKLSKDNLSNQNLPFIFGKPEIRDFLKFKKMIDDSDIKYEKIKSFYFFQSKRWDIEIENNILLKLSKNNTKDSLESAIIFLKDNRFKNIKIVDARVNNQIVLNE